MNPGYVEQKVAAWLDTDHVSWIDKRLTQLSLMKAHDKQPDSLKHQESHVFKNQISSQKLFKCEERKLNWTLNRLRKWKNSPTTSWTTKITESQCTQKHQVGSTKMWKFKRIGLHLRKYSMWWWQNRRSQTKCLRLFRSEYRGLQNRMNSRRSILWKIRRQRQLQGQRSFN